MTLTATRQRLHQFDIEALRLFWQRLPDSDPADHLGCGFVPTGTACPACGKHLGDPLPKPYSYQTDLLEDDHLTIEVAGGEQAGKSQGTAMKFYSICYQFLAEYAPSGRADGEVAWIAADSYELTRREAELVSQWFTASWNPTSLKPGLQPVKNVDPGQIVITVPGKAGGLGKFTIKTRSANDEQTLRAESPVAVLVCENALLTEDAFDRLNSRVGRSRSIFPGFGAIIMGGTFEGSLGWKAGMWTELQSHASQETRNARSFSLPSFSNVFVYGPKYDSHGNLVHKGGEDHPVLVRLKAELPDYLYDERIRAIPAPPSGRVHHSFNRAIHVELSEYDEDEPIYIGADPGYSGQPSHYAVEVFQRRPTECGYRHFWGIPDGEIFETLMSPSEVATKATNKYWWRNPHKYAVMDVSGRQHAGGGAEPQIDTWRREVGLHFQSQPVKVNDGRMRMDMLLNRCPVDGIPFLTFHPDQHGVLSELGGEMHPRNCKCEGSGKVRVYSWQTDRTGVVTGSTPRDEWCDGIKATAYLFMNQLGPTNHTRGGSKIRVISKRERLGLM